MATLTPTSTTVAAAGGTFAVTVSDFTGCTWTATSGASWITISSGASGSGNGTTQVNVAANTTTSSRTGTLSVNGHIVTVTQAGLTCSPSITPTTSSIAAGGGYFYCDDDSQHRVHVDGVEQRQLGHDCRRRVRFRQRHDTGERRG